MAHCVSRILTFAVMTVSGTPLLAHPGHIIDIAGHSHWGALIALGGAIAIGAWAAKGKKKPESSEEKVDAEEVTDAELQEA